MNAVKGMINYCRNWLVFYRGYIMVMDSTKCIKEAEMPQNISIGCLFVTEIIGKCHGLSTLSHLNAEYGTLLIWRDCQGNFEHAHPMKTKMNFTYVSAQNFELIMAHALRHTHGDGCNS